ncbi:general transcription repressor, partial [Tulasnella sp. 427]
MDTDFDRLVHALDSTLSELNHLKITPDRLTVVQEADSMCGGSADVHCAKLSADGSAAGVVVAVKQLRPAGTKLQRLRIAIANVLVTDDFQAVLMDFGLSKALEGAPSGLTTTSFGLRGSTRYMSPELVSEDDARRTLASDVWAWGCLLLEILTDRLPYADITSNAKIILTLARLLLAPARPNDMFPAPIDGLPIPDDLRSLLKNCWKISPEARPTMIQCLTGLSLRSRDTWANAPVASVEAASASREVLASFMELDLGLVAPELMELGSDWFAIHNEDAASKMDIASAFIVEHPNPVLCVRFSNDGKLLAAISGRSAHIYDALSGKLITTLVDESTHKYLYVRAAAFSPDGSLLATGSEDRKVRVWDINTGKVIHTFRGHVHKINAVCFSSCGSFLLSGSSDKTLWVWDLDTGGHHAIHVGSRVKSVALLARDRFVAVTAEKEIQLWDIEEDRLAYRIPAHDFDAVAVVVAKGGEVLVSAGVEDEVKVWDVNSVPEAGTMDGEEEKEWSEHYGYPSPPPDDGRSMMESMEEDEEERTRVLPNCLATLSTERRDQRFNVVSVAATKDAAWIVSGTQNRGVWIWNPKTGLPQLMLGCHYRSVMTLDVSPTGDASEGMFASGGEDGTLKGDTRSTVLRTLRTFPVEPKGKNDDDDDFLELLTPHPFPLFVIAEARSLG